MSDLLHCNLASYADALWARHLFISCQIFPMCNLSDVITGVDIPDSRELTALAFQFYIQRANARQQQIRRILTPVLLFVSGCVHIDRIATFESFTFCVHELRSH